MEPSILVFLCVAAAAGILLCGAVASIVFMATRKPDASNRGELAHLREEIARLREENEQLKARPSTSGSTDIK